MADVPPGMSELVAKVGETLRLTLPGGGASGHAWRIEAPASLKVENGGIEPAKTFGGRSAETFLIEPTRAGRLIVRLLLQAPWRDAPAEIRELSLKVRK